MKYSKDLLPVAAALQYSCLVVGLAAAMAGCGGGSSESDASKTPSAPPAPASTSAELSTQEDTPSAAVAPSVNGLVAPYVFTVLAQGRNGAATVVGNQLVYTPVSNFNGVDRFTYRATDANGTSVTGVAEVVVAAVNDRPTATGGSRAVYVSSSGSRTPWVDDVDVWDTSSFKLLTPPTKGSVVFSGTQWTYAPSAGTNGTDSFTYEAKDGSGAAVNGTAKLRIYDSAALAECTRNSTVNTDGTLNTRTRSNACAYYSSTQTRVTASGAAVTMDYFGHTPSNGAPSKAIVVLIGGGDFNMGLSGDSNGVASSSGGANFLVRTAQLFAEAGYTALALDRPSDEPPAGSSDSITDADQYRISVKHAVDIVNVLKHANSANLDVFIVGTSRGAISSVSQSRIASAVGIVSPVTMNAVPSHLYVGRADVPSLLPGSVRRPTLVTWHQDDLCGLTRPADSQKLYNSLLASGIPATANIESGGVRVTTPSGTAPDNVVPDVCGAHNYHGYLGIESTVVGHITKWFDDQLASRHGNKRPQVSFAETATAAGVQLKLDLSRFARDADGDALTFELSHSITTLGGSISIDGSTVTYTPPMGVSNRPDQFVYIVTDGRGGVAAAVVTVQILS